MATQTKKKPQNTVLVRNPAKVKTLQTTKAKTNGSNMATKKATPAKKKPVKKNPATATKTYTKKKKVKRNPSGLMGLLLTGLAGGIAFGLTQTGINFIAPSASHNLQILISAGGAYVLDRFVKPTTPIIGKYAKNLSWILAIFAGYGVWTYYISPMIQRSGLSLPSLSLFGGSQPQQLQDGAEMGDPYYGQVGDGTLYLPEPNAEILIENDYLDKFAYANGY